MGKKLLSQQENSCPELNVGVRVRITLRIAVYGQSVCFGDKPLETDDNFYIPTEHLRL
jgi:hypothetical protein